MSKKTPGTRVGAVASLLASSAVLTFALAAHAQLPAPTTKYVVPGPPASTGVKLEGDIFWTATSGNTAEKAASLGQDNDFQALYATTFWEDGDDPCKLDASTRHLNQEDNTNVDSTEFCPGSPGSAKVVKRSAKNEYVTALQVCVNDKKDSAKDKVKGLRLWGRIVDPKTGSLGAENGPDEGTRPNCDTWRAKVSCPAGMVASKLRVYSSRYSGSGAGVAKGLALGCRRVVRK